MAKRINVILAEATVQTVDRLSGPGQRSRFIERAVQHYVTTASQDALQERLKRAALRDYELDRGIASDWHAVDQEQWQTLGKQEKQQPSAGLNAAKSTSRRSTRRPGTKSDRPGRS